MSYTNVNKRQRESGKFICTKLVSEYLVSSQLNSYVFSPILIGVASIKRGKLDRIDVEHF